MSGGWPGVFRPLRHHVPDDARRLPIDGGWVYFASCGSPCWPPVDAADELPWCWQCRPPIGEFASPLPLP